MPDSTCLRPLLGTSIAHRWPGASRANKMKKQGDSKVCANRPEEGFVPICEKFAAGGTSGSGTLVLQCSPFPALSIQVQACPGMFLGWCGSFCGVATIDLALVNGSILVVVLAPVIMRAIR
jgi:hypothetical protein